MIRLFSLNGNLVFSVWKAWTMFGEFARDWMVAMVWQYVESLTMPSLCS